MALSYVASSLVATPKNQRKPDFASLRSFAEQRYLARCVAPQDLSLLPCCYSFLIQGKNIASVPGSPPYACTIFTYDLWTPRNEKSGGEPSIFYHVSDVEGREKVGRTRLRVGGQTRKLSVAHAFVQSPFTRRCTAMYILLARRKAIHLLQLLAPWSTSMIYACTPTLYAGLVHFK